MLVYRLEEQNTGKGIYSRTETYGYLVDNLPIDPWCGSEQHPAPWQDGLNDYKGKHFGFKDKKQLKSWFPRRFLKAMDEIEHTCVVAIYKVRKNYVNFGGRQICFDKSKAVLVSQHSFKEFY